MPEPSTTGSVTLVAFAVALLGPMAGEYAAIVVSALAGALWALKETETSNRMDGAKLLLRLVLTAVVLTGGLALIVQSIYGWPAHHLISPLAFGIGAFGNRWRTVIDAVAARVRRMFAGGAAPDSGSSPGSTSGDTR